MSSIYHKTKFMTNYETSEKIEYRDNIEIEKVDQYKYLGQTGWLFFGKYKEIFENKDIQHSVLFWL